MPLRAAVVGVVCLPPDVYDAMCTSVSEAADVERTIGKHLGLLVGPSGSCSAQRATPPGSVNT